MDKINETNLTLFDNGNNTQYAQTTKNNGKEQGENKEEDGEEEDLDIPMETDQDTKTEKVKENQSNLQILLTQNDIIELLSRINKQKGVVRLADYVQQKKVLLLKKKREEKRAPMTSRAKLDDLDVGTNETDDEVGIFGLKIGYVKLEEQPENLKNGQLKEYQLEALNWMIKLYYSNVNGILADEMGLGKTIQTISLLAYMMLIDRSFIHLIIVPKVTLNNWRKEITKWLPEARLLVFYGNKEERRSLVENELKSRNYDIVLTTFECSISEKTALSKINYEYLIIDEAHRIKNEKAKISSVVRQYHTNHRLLLTGTPLQNNLHELWALLNFLMPNIFNDSGEFDEIFNLDTASEFDQQKIVKQIHQLLKPFVLRRLKSEVEFKLPPKKEIYLYVGLSDLQKLMYKQILSKNIDAVNGISKDKIQLLNILMQLKKVCNHPYLFPKVEAGPPYVDGEHLIDNSMKLKILDVLLNKLYNEGSRVLIFSQMTTLLNILDDYCRFRGYRYCRIDGSTSSEDRDSRIEDFQRPGSDKFIFLLSTRAGGLGINLHSANTVILYDSDWNPQVDLQAIDRAHRIGQTKPVTIYRFVTEGTVEEKIIERAAKKLKIDHLIIQRGKAVQNKVSALEMTSILQYGAEKLFDQTREENKKSIEEILEYSISKTDKLKEHLKDIEEKLNINNLSLTSDKNDIYQFEGEDYKKKILEDDSFNPNFVNLSYCFGQRERKQIISNLEEKKKQEYRKPKPLTGWRAKAGGGYSHQFYDVQTLEALDLKEEKWNEYLKLIENGADENKLDQVDEFTEEDEAEREKLLTEGFSNWTKKEFTRLLRACEVYGFYDALSLSKSIKTKSPEEVEEYLKVFHSRLDELPNAARIRIRIKKFESETNKNIEYQEILDNLLDTLSQKGENILKNIKIPYVNNNKSKKDESFDAEEDKYLVCLLFKYGYKQWDHIRAHILNDPYMKFNINMKIKTNDDLLERSNYLISCFKTASTKKKSNDSKKQNISKKKKKIKKKKSQTTNKKDKTVQKSIKNYINK